MLKRLSSERRAAAVALDVATGEVVAMAAVPDYDPHRDHGGSAAARSCAASTRRDADPLVNRATSGLYPPGSTFKMVTTLAALEAGVVDLRERIECTGSYD